MKDAIPAGIGDDGLAGVENEPILAVYEPEPEEEQSGLLRSAWMTMGAFAIASTAMIVMGWVQPGLVVAGLGFYYWVSMRRLQRVFETRARLTVTPTHIIAEREGERRVQPLTNLYRIYSPRSSISSRPSRVYKILFADGSFYWIQGEVEKFIEELSRASKVKVSWNPIGIARRSLRKPLP